MTQKELKQAEKRLMNAGIKIDRTENVFDDSAKIWGLTVHFFSGGQKIFWSLDQVEYLENEAQQRGI